ncbi:MAG: ABC transporter permease [Planctomycetes bacterium]|nr:ABC transporter permease [Planctomycetota bacterium]
MPFAWFVALRYLRDAKGQTALILAAVSVGVGVVVFLSALIDGLQVSLIDKTLGSQPHVTLRVPREAPRLLTLDTRELAIARIVLPAPQRLRSIDRWLAVMAEVEAVADVTAVSPVVSGAGFAVRSEAKEPMVLQGVDPDRFLAILDLRPKIVAGRFDVAGDGVAIGSTLARDLDAVVGDRLRIETTEGREDVVTVTGIFTLGNEAVDRTWVLASLRHAQSLYALPGGATTLELKVSDVFEAERVATDLRDRTGLDADSWMTLNEQLLAGLAAQERSKTMIQVLVVIAVALGIASVLAVSVVQKSREIGILRAVGTTSRRVLAVFLIQGGVLGLAGSFLGFGLGALLAKLFESTARRPDGTPDFLVLLDAALFASATVLATVIGVLAATIPAWRAARIDPAQAIRNG